MGHGHSTCINESTSKLHEDDTNITLQVEEGTSRALNILLKIKAPHAPVNVNMKSHIMNVDSASQNVGKSNEDTIPGSQKATITFEKESWPVVSERWNK
eukprot:12419555-Karenia_brevis.AAC.1